MELTQSQSKRLRRQANTLLVWFKKRCHQIKMALDHFEQNPADAMRDFYHAYPEQSIESLVKSTCEVAVISIKTFQKWRKQYILHGAFERSQRGLQKFGWLLVNEDKKLQLTNWLKEQNEISVQSVRDYINGTLLADFPVGRIPNYGTIRRPVSATTAHRWMLNCGCTWEPTAKSYLTHSHERHSTLLYRIWFCDFDYFVSLRMHRWVCFSSDDLRKLKVRFKEEWPNDDLGHKIPVNDVGKFPPGLPYKYNSNYGTHTRLIQILIYSYTHVLNYRCWNLGLCSDRW